MLYRFYKSLYIEAVSFEMDFRATGVAQMKETCGFTIS